MLNGFVGWFEAQLSPSERLDTGPTTRRPLVADLSPLSSERSSGALPVGGLSDRTRSPGAANVRLTLTVGSASQIYIIE